MDKNRRIYFFDSTLRDGSQTRGIDFNLADKRAIAEALDNLGVDYIEGGWPGANPTDDAFFSNLPLLSKSSFVAFGMTRRPGVNVTEDLGIAKFCETNVSVICMVGKAWDFHVKHALETTLDENLKMIQESVEEVGRHKQEVMFDAEHFFDGYKANPNFALNCLEAAFKGGARWIVLCDTNGGSLPSEIRKIVGKVTEVIPAERLGIHCHNDTGNAVGNTFAALEAGVCQIQGTANGLGERCGNANLLTLIATLFLKTDYTLPFTESQINSLTGFSRLIDERLGLASDGRLPYVGQDAFAHKGGIHAAAVSKFPHCYEHVDPKHVGNERKILVSNQAGRSNILNRLKEINVDVTSCDKKVINRQVSKLVNLVKEREFMGYAYDSAEASFELLAHQLLFDVPHYYRCHSFRVIDERRWNVLGELVTISEATVKVAIDGEELMAVAEGNGPVNALDVALRKILVLRYPALELMRLVDYKVRILTPNDATEAVTRVLIESTDQVGNTWRTVGVSANIIDASYNALRDSIIYMLYKADMQNEKRREA